MNVTNPSAAGLMPLVAEQTQTAKAVTPQGAQERAGVGAGRGRTTRFSTCNRAF
jgi:hypothetical protein